MNAPAFAMPHGCLDSRERWERADLDAVRDAFRAETGPAPECWDQLLMDAAASASDPFYAAGIMEYMAHVRWRQGGGRWDASALAFAAEGMAPLEGPETLIAKALAVPAVAMNSPAAMVWQDREESGAFRTMDWGALAASTPPDRPWIVPEWIPARAATLLAGSGGTGKSLLVQQWLTAIATGTGFLGMAAAEPVRALYVNCEDDHDELWRRQFDICRAAGVELLHLQAAGLHILPRMGGDNRLGVFDDDGRFLPGELFRHVRSYAVAHGVKLIALDNLAHLFPGNENDRALVTAFCSALAGLALDIGGAVILVGHPAKVAGSTFSGSTAWEAAVRQRLYLSREVDGDGNEIDASDVRTLSIGKANYAARGQDIEMLWRGGAFHSVERGDTPAGETIAEQVFLKCLDEATAAKRNVSDKPSPAYAPKVFSSMAAGKKAGKPALERAMNRLFDRGLIVANAPLWRDERNRRPAHGIARASPWEGAQTPAQTPAQTGAQTRADHNAQTRANTHLYTTYIRGGPSGAPAPQDEDHASHGSWGDE